VHYGVYALIKTMFQLECERRKNWTLLHHQNSEPSNEIFKLFYDYFEFL